MSLALLDVHADTLTTVTVLAPRHYQDLATAAYEDAELLLGAILPDARIEHVGASAVPGAYSRGGVDICVAVPAEAFDEARGVLVEAGYLPAADAGDDARRALLTASQGDVPLMLYLIESGSEGESLLRARDALRRDPALLARSNAVKIDAAAQGAAAYAAAKAAFFATI